MGLCQSPKKPNIKPGMDNGDYIPEKRPQFHPKSLNKKDMKIINEQMQKSVCKINNIGTGFFCNIPFPDNSKTLPVLITNNHVLRENDIAKDNIISVSVNDEESKYSIHITNSTRTYTDPESGFDISIIEIVKKEELDKVSFLEIEDNILNIKHYDQYKDKSVYLLHYPDSRDIECSVGTINNVSLDNYRIIHYCETKGGSSGSPILNLETYKILGIHKGAHPKFDYNLGTFMKGPIEAFNLKYKEKEEKKERIDEIPIINERITKDKISPKINLDQIEIITNQMKKSVCKIIDGNKRGTGFFCEIPLSKENKNIPVLITNEHILNEKDILPGKTIYYSMNDDDNLIFSVKIDNSRKIFTNHKLDYTIIELKKGDKLDFISFLEIDNSFLTNDYYKNVDKNLDIYLIHYSFGKKVGYSTGKLIHIEEGDTMKYIADTNLGSGGCPILNTNNFKLIGIHKARDRYNNTLFGISIKAITKDIDLKLSFRHN